MTMFSHDGARNIGFSQRKIFQDRVSQSNISCLQYSIFFPSIHMSSFMAYFHTLFEIRPGLTFGTKGADSKTSKASNVSDMALST